MSSEHTGLRRSSVFRHTCRFRHERGGSHPSFFSAPGSCVVVQMFLAEVPIRGRGGVVVDTGNYAVADVTRLFVAEVLLPAQVDYPPADRWLHRLCLAILEDVLKYLGGHAGDGDRRARARDRNEAWDWVLSDAEYCFSFTTVCSVLHLDAEAVRRQLRHRFAGSASQAGVSRQLRQPLARAPAARAARSTRGRRQ